MLIKPSETRWRRDPGISELIRHFDQGSYETDPFTIPSRELKVIEQEIRKCREDFEYAARNYFWIVDKEGNDRPFALWESQELILDKIYQLRAKKKIQKLMILKARQLGCSTLIEALIAWRSMFFPNVNAMVLSNVPKHAEYLYGIMLHIYDQLPWWMKPMISSRRQQDGLHFQNPDQDARRVDPGLNSMVIVQAANQVSGVGQGYRLNAVHGSEYCDWEEWRAREIIDGDMVHALAENVGTFAVLESTPKGAGTYGEDLWLANVDLAEKAEWTPLFLPFFFEKTRFVAPDVGWHPDVVESARRDRVFDEWVCCSNCGEFRERHARIGSAMEDLADTHCGDCSTGILEPYILRDDQLCWMWEKRINAERRGPDSVKELKQELCTTSEEAWQLSGIQVFPQDTIDQVISDIREPIYTGNFDAKGNIHAAQKTGDKWHCMQEWCAIDHRNDYENPLRLWEMPIEGARYTCGVDVAEGLGGKSDFSVAWVNRVGTPPNADYHVATYRSNLIDPAHFAAPVNFLGRTYNEALMSIEYNIYQTTADLVRIFYQYPNLFRWKHLDSISSPMSNKWHWLTQLNSKPLLWQTAVRWLRAKQWVVRDEVFAHEMKRFQKEDYDSKSASAERRFHDDVIIAGMICLYTSHDMDWNEGASEMPMAKSTAGLMAMQEWKMTCLRCANEFGAANPEEVNRCGRCGSIMLKGTRLGGDGHRKILDFEEIGKDMQEENNMADLFPEMNPDAAEERLKQWQRLL